jgi:hypothetical protein
MPRSACSWNAASVLSAWMLLNVSDQLEDALPPGIETQGDART